MAAARPMLTCHSTPPPAPALLSASSAYTSLFSVTTKITSRVPLPGIARLETYSGWA